MTLDVAQAMRTRPPRPRSPMLQSVETWPCVEMRDHSGRRPRLGEGDGTYVARTHAAARIGPDGSRSPAASHGTAGVGTKQAGLRSAPGQDVAAGGSPG